MEAKSNDELKSIAQGLLSGTIFSVQSYQGIRTHFMPIAFGALSDLSEDERKDIGLIYEYMDKAGPLAVNGKPCFMSFRILSVADTEKVMEYMQKIEKALDEM